MLKIYMAALCAGLLVSSTSYAKDCRIAVFKTAVPKSPGKGVCYDGLPAEWLEDADDMFEELTQLGYKPFPHDQCEHGDENIKASYILVTQIGDCSWTGNIADCTLFSGIYDNQSSKELGSSHLNLSAYKGDFQINFQKALKNMPRCND